MLQSIVLLVFVLQRFLNWCLEMAPEGQETEVHKQEETNQGKEPIPAPHPVESK